MISLVIIFVIGGIMNKIKQVMTLHSIILSMIGFATASHSGGDDLGTSSASESDHVESPAQPSTIEKARSRQAARYARYLAAKQASKCVPVGTSSATTTPATDASGAERGGATAISGSPTADSPTDPASGDHDLASTDSQAEGDADVIHPRISSLTDEALGATNLVTVNEILGGDILSASDDMRRLVIGAITQNLGVARHLALVEGGMVRICQEWMLYEVAGIILADLAHLQYMDGFTPVVLPEYRELVETREAQLFTGYLQNQLLPRIESSNLPESVKGYFRLAFTQDSIPYLPKSLILQREVGTIAGYASQVFKGRSIQMSGYFQKMAITELTMQGSEDGRKISAIVDMKRVFTPDLIEQLGRAQCATYLPHAEHVRALQDLARQIDITLGDEITFDVAQVWILTKIIYAFIISDLGHFGEPVVVPAPTIGEFSPEDISTRETELFQAYTQRLLIHINRSTLSPELKVLLSWYLERDDIYVPLAACQERAIDMGEINLTTRYAEKIARYFNHAVILEFSR